MNASNKLKSKYHNLSISIEEQPILAAGKVSVVQQFSYLGTTEQGYRVQQFHLKASICDTLSMSSASTQVSHDMHTVIEPQATFRRFSRSQNLKLDEAISASSDAFYEAAVHNDYELMKYIISTQSNQESIHKITMKAYAYAFDHKNNELLKYLMEIKVHSTVNDKKQSPQRIIRKPELILFEQLKTSLELITEKAKIILNYTLI